MSFETADIPAAAIEQAVPWIVQYQRAQCLGGSPLNTFQGVVCDEIILPQSAAESGDPAQLVAAADAWVEALTNQAQYLPGEFAQEALWSLYARDYAGPKTDAPIILCLPGLTRNSKDFAELADELRKNYRVICPDQRGRGRSERPARARRAPPPRRLPP